MYNRFINQPNSAQRRPLTEENWRRIEDEISRSQEMKFYSPVKLVSDYLFRIVFLLTGLFYTMMLARFIISHYWPGSFLKNLEEVLVNILIILCLVKVIATQIKIRAGRKVMKLREKLLYTAWANVPQERNDVESHESLC